MEGEMKYMYGHVDQEKPITVDSVNVDAMSSMKTQNDLSRAFWCFLIV